jgi:hypothetical protein
MAYPPDEPPRRPSFTPHPQQQPYGQPGPWPPQPPQGQWPPPYAQQPYPPQGQQYPPQPPGPPRRRRRHRTARAFAISSAGLLVAVIAIIAATGGGKGNAAAPTSATSSAPAVAASSVTASTQAPARAHTVATITGSGIQNTPKFTVTATWKLVYSFSCASFGQAGNFIVDEDGGNDFNGVSVNDLAMSRSGSTWAYGDAGTHYLAVNSECSWKVAIVDEP